jgi:hypothetical protein
MLLCGLLCAIAHAAPPIPEVIVQAQRQHELERRAHVFVGKLTTHDRFYGGESLALWRVPVCFLVAGMPKTDNERVVSRLSADAASAGVRLAGQHCIPNFIVFLTPSPDSELARLKARYPRMLGDGPPAEIARFLNQSRGRAVRTWHNADEINRDGAVVYAFGDGGCVAYPLPPCHGSSDFSVSRLNWDLMLSFSFAIIVVDRDLVKNLTLDQLADYSALVGLASINPDADVGDTPSILQLFTPSAEPAPQGLTSWDQAFLSGLYHTDQASRGQRREIEKVVVRAVSH